MWPALSNSWFTFEATSETHGCTVSIVNINSYVGFIIAAIVVMDKDWSDWGDNWMVGCWTISSNWGYAVLFWSVYTASNFSSNDFRCCCWVWLDENLFYFCLFTLFLWSSSSVVVNFSVCVFT